MDQLSKPEVLISGGALVISIGSFVYLNTKIETLDASLKQTSDRFLTVLAKLSEHEGNIKVSSSKISEIEALHKSIINIQNNISELRESLSTELKSIGKEFKNHDKRIKSIESKLAGLGLSAEVEEVVVPPKIKKRKKREPGVIPEVKSSLESSVADEMNFLMNIS